jgi:hypothetical protein
MAHIEIRSGLRKLEFDSRSSGRSSDPVDRALVEFACDAPLPSAEQVRIELGLRNGVLREVTGRPELIEARDERHGQRQYVYRLNAVIAKVAHCESRQRKADD